MRKKILAILVITLLITTVVSVTGLQEKNEKNNLEQYTFITNNLPPDQLDQQSTKDDATRIITHYHLAQSFIPTLPKLTRILVLLTKSGGDLHYEYIDFEIRKDDLDSNAIIKVSIPRNDFVNGNYWYEFDFIDIDVTIGSTYYVVIRGNTTVSGTGSISWHYGYPDPYPNGAAYRNSPGGWFDLNSTYECDFCFKTFGIFENLRPKKPIILGPTSGKAGTTYDYTFVSIDPDGDDLFYWILWFDGCPGVTWDGPYQSGQEIIKSYAWNDEGTYTIQVKAKDVYDAESDWANLEVSIPKTKPEIKRLDDDHSKGLWFVKGKFRFISKDEDYIYLKAVSAKICGIGRGITIYRLFFCPIKVSRPFLGYMIKQPRILPRRGFGICGEWDYSRIIPLLH